MRIAIVYPPESFGAQKRSLDEASHLTGTDQVALFTAKYLRDRGHGVTLYRPGDGFDQWAERAIGLDVAIAISNPNPLKHCPDTVLRVVNRQVGRFGPDCDPSWQDWTDLVICPSESAKRFVSEGLNRPSFAVVPNGINLPTGPQPAREPGKCIYASSPDRGLHLLLGVWPRIRQRVPYATLDVYYATLQSYLEDNVRTDKPVYCDYDETHVRRACFIRHALRRLEAFGVRAVGGVSHEAMVTAMRRAELLTYPCEPVAYTETFGCAVAEAMAAGCVPVISTADAFGELWAPHCPHVPAPAHEHLNAYVELVSELLTNADTREAHRRRVMNVAGVYSWPVVAERIERALTEAIADKRAPVAAPMPPKPRRRISMVLTSYGTGNVAIDPETPYEAQTGGGCRVGFVGLTRAMARRGWDVTAYSTWSREAEVEGVRHAWASRVERADHDVLLAYYDTRPLIGSRARVRIGSHHTYQLPANTNEWEHVRCAPSQYACDVMAPVYGGEWAVLPNAVPPGLPRWKPVEGRCIYHTSPDRGLHRLIAMWPQIREEVPGATLHIVGDPESWALSLRDVGSTQGDRARAFERALPEAMRAGGVSLLGRLSREQMNRELAEAACFPFWCDPAGPCETWSTSVVECLAVGVPVVLRPADALRSLWQNVALMADGEPQFVRHVVTVLTDDMVAQQISGGKAVTELVSGLTFEAAAERLEMIIACADAARGNGQSRTVARTSFEPVHVDSL